MEQKHIDLDQGAIEDYLEGANHQSFVNARSVYEKGAFSKSVATVALDSDTPISITAEPGIPVFGKNIAGGEVRLKAYAALMPGDSTIQIQYVTEGCNVGGLVGPQNIVEPLDLTDSGDQIWDGCLAESGTITIEGTSYTYTYSIPEDNWNGRTIAQFSTAAETKMRPNQSTDAYFPDFQYFVDYYGVPDYANEWIISAFEGVPTTNLAKGSADFSVWSDDYAARAGEFRDRSVDVSHPMGYSQFCHPLFPQRLSRRGAHTWLCLCT